MIIEYIRYDLKQHQPDDLIAAYRTAAPHLEAAPQCLGYELTRCVEEPASLTLRILWTSTDDHLQGFRKGPHFPPFLAAIRPFIGEIAEMRHYEATDLSWQR
ncbi:antibiotic biosynthesis monooxygenase family protein [Ciceribacter sp. L1K22]|uniref:putative quinol monooxygenase n=1 Tax=Ciceribacter sp. L1K22 TaxID=2820275 RepID=UPI001ABEA6BE|nr:antibiotic biosynthesis monooxygenase family protein [Ciceribacter sp. L1K22]MBO3758643.1 antibiotic biosynthesis monooxygenase [Ciceribacter sp. L1K22]